MKTKGHKKTKEQIKNLDEYKAKILKLQKNEKRQCKMLHISGIIELGLKPNI